MASQNLGPTYVAAYIGFPVLEKFRGNELPDFYAAIRHHHNFETFEQRADEGAVMATDGERRLELTRSSLEILEYPRTSFDVVRKTAVDLIGTAERQFALYAMQLRSVRIRGILQLPDDGPDALMALRDQVINIDRETYDILGAPERARLAFEGHRSDPDVGWDIEIGPRYEDPHQLDLRLATHAHYSVDRPESMGEFMQLSYDFLDAQIVSFVHSLLAA